MTHQECSIEDKVSGAIAIPLLTIYILGALGLLIYGANITAAILMTPLPMMGLLALFPPWRTSDESQAQSYFPSWQTTTLILAATVLSTFTWASCLA